jgi:hypothetical protein
VTHSWKNPAEVTAGLDRRWLQGRYLTALALGEPITPLRLPLRAPSPTDLATDPVAVRDWVQRWRSHADRHHLELEWAAVGGRRVGTNQVPTHVRCTRDGDLWRWLGVSHEVARFGALLDLIREQRPQLLPWVSRHPWQVTGLGQEWPALLAVLAWVDQVGTGDEAVAVLSRQVDVPGVDTKFVERQQRLLTQLMREGAPSGDDPAGSNPQLPLGLKPTYLLLRRLDGTSLLSGARGPAELGMRVADAAAFPPRASRILIVENETTFLTLPRLPDVVAIYGQGYAAARLASLTWLAERDVAYWGDIDTHGFAILDQLRAAFPPVCSLLMDSATLVAHEAHWVTEIAPAVRLLPNLTAAEAALYRELVEGHYGRRIRLEQERVTSARVHSTLTTWTEGPAGRHP